MLHGLAHRMQVFRERHIAVLGDIQKACDGPTKISIIKEKKMTNNHGYFCMDMKKMH